MSRFFTFHASRILLPLGLFAISPCCNAEELIYRSSEGEIHTIEIYPEAPFSHVIDQIQQRHSENAMHSEPQQFAEGQRQEFLIDFLIASNIPRQKAAAKAFQRDYSKGLSSSEKADISYIITTLGNASLGALATAKSSLKKAGDRIELVHPLQFLAYVFTDEKLKAAMHNLQGRTFWIWNEFFNGIKRSFDEEASRDNINPYLDDFASRIKLEVPLLAPLFQNKNWKQLINTLLEKIPRQGNTERYNM